MSQKTKGKGAGLRQMEFNYERPCYRTKGQAKRLNELLAIKGIYRGSDARFVVLRDSRKNK